MPTMSVGNESGEASAVADHVSVVESKVRIRAVEQLSPDPIVIAAIDVGFVAYVGDDGAGFGVFPVDVVEAGVSDRR